MSKKLKLRELEDRLYWMNECLENFNQGYGEYLLEQYILTKGKDQIPLTALTMVMFGEDEEEPNGVKYSRELHEFAGKLYRREHDDIEKLKDYKKLIKTQSSKWVSDLVKNKTKKSDRKQFLDNIKAYDEFYTELDLYV